MQNQSYFVQPMVSVAPLQGFTEAPFRHFHAEIYGGADCYFSPFIRMEHGEPRSRDMRDITSELNVNHSVVPQIIFKDINEFDVLVDAVKSSGYDRVDMNLGCPFPPQVNRGRGSGAIVNRGLLEEVATRTRQRDDIRFSLKMRLGAVSAEESMAVADVIDSMRLTHVAIHPRVARQQYKGDLLIDDFMVFARKLHHRIVFNGDILTVDDIDRIVSDYPWLAGVMVGRGLLRRPSLLAEWREKRLWSDDERKSRLMEFHKKLYGYYSSVMCGDSQILSKIKPFWEYLMPEIDRKVAKMIHKSTSCQSYIAAVGKL